MKSKICLRIFLSCVDVKWLVNLAFDQAFFNEIMFTVQISSVFQRKRAVITWYSTRNVWFLFYFAVISEHLN